MTTKWKKNLRRSTLATLITLALTGSAFAMPSGGVVEQGRADISAGNLAQVESGATITAQTNSIINWNDFSIGVGQTLNFNTAAGALLNCVTSDKVSELLGTMTQTGVNPLFVVNPNGIHIGGGATIDAANITLSTLAMSSGDFNAAASGGTYSLAQGKAGVKTVQIDSGAKIKSGNMLNIFGGKIVADGVIFNERHGGLEKAPAMIVAAERTTLRIDDGELVPVNSTITKENTVDFHGKIQTQNTDFRIAGSSVNLDNAVVDAGGSSKFEAMAVKQASYNDNAYREDADATNVLSANGFTGRSGQYCLSGGKVDLKNSSITGSKIEIRGEQDFQYSGDMDRGNAVEEHRAGLENTVTLDNVKLNQQGSGDYAWFYINGGKVTIKNNSEIASEVTGNISAAQYVKRNSAMKGNTKSTEFDWQTTKGNALTVDGGKLTGNTDVAHPDEDSLTLVGSTVDLSNVNIEAAGQFSAGAVQRMHGVADGNEITAVKGNALRTDGVNIKAHSMYMAGGNVQLRNTVANVTEDSSIEAVKTWTVVGERESMTADLDNVLHLDNTKIRLGGDLTLGSGTMNLVNGTELKGDELTFGAGQSHDGTTTRVTADNKVNLWKTKIEGRDVELHAGGAGIWDGSTVDATEKLNADTPVVRVDGSTISLQRDAASHVRLKGVEATEVKVVSTVPTVPALPKLPDVPVSPMPSVSPAGEDVSASDAENMETGERKARAALDASHNAVERRENLTIQMRELSQKSPNGRASIGIIMGAIQAINKASNISDAEKYTLMQTVINADDTTNRIATAQDTTTVVSTEDAVDVATHVEDPMQPLTMDEAEETIIFADQR